MKILALSDVHGQIEMLRKVREVAPADLGMVVFTGDIVKGKARGDEWLAASAEGRAPYLHRRGIELEAEEDVRLYDQFFEVLRQWEVPAFFVPGNMDAPKQRYFESVLRNSHGSDKIHCVHGSPALFEDFVLCGAGGEATEESREDFFVLQTPRCEVERLLNSLQDLRDRRFVLLFHTPPIGQLDLDKGEHKGSSVVNDFIEKYQPWLAFCGHAHNSRGRELIGETVVINPGSLKGGNYALVDVETRDAELLNVSG